MKYYRMYPVLYAASSFVPSEPIHTDILVTRFTTLKGAVNFAKQTGVCLREQNWIVYEIAFFGSIKRKIPLSFLSEVGLISKEQSTDSIGSYYHWL